MEKYLKENNERMEKIRQKQRNKEMGYSPRCTLCNLDNIDEIEEEREAGATYEEIKDRFNLDVSIMSISRHFTRHYPQSVKYKEKQKLKLFKNIKKALEKNPFLESVFENKDIEYIEEFSDYGFCLDTFDLCSNVLPFTVSDGVSVVNSLFERQTHELKEHYKNTYSYARFRNEEDDAVTDIIHRYQPLILRCLNCKNEAHEKRINLLERVIMYNFLDMDVNNRELYFTLLNFEGSTHEFIKYLEDTRTNTTDTTS